MMPTVSSRPGMYSSTSASSPKDQSSDQSRLSPSATTRTPMVEPSATGLTMKGRGSGSPSAKSSRRTTRPRGVRMPACSTARFVAGLSMAIAEARTPECV